MEQPPNVRLLLVPCVSKSMKRFLPLRPRLVYTRLAPLRYPVRVVQLVKLLGGLIDRHSLGLRLAELEKLGLVAQTPEGWFALEPQSNRDLEPKNNRDYFLWPDSRAEYEEWHRRWTSWKLPLPSQMPWKKRKNALECWAVYWAGQYLQQQGDSPKIKQLAAFLKITPKSVRAVLMRLADDGLYVDGRFRQHHFDLQVNEENEAAERKAACDNLDALDHRIRGLSGVKEIRAVIAQLTAGCWMLRGQILKIVGDALKQHKNSDYPGDGSALVLDWLGGRLRTRHAIEIGEQQKLVDSIRQSERQAAAIEAFSKEREAERKEPKVTELLASKVFPGENLKPSHLHMLYTESEMQEAWLRVKDCEGLTKAQLMGAIRPTQGRSPTSQVSLGVVVGTSPRGETTNQNATEVEVMASWFAELPRDCFEVRNQNTLATPSPACEPLDAELLAALDAAA